MTRIRSALAAWAFLVAAAPACGQPYFADPLADAATYLASRPAPAESTYRARYESVFERGDAPAQRREVVIDVAPDWALIDDGESRWLRDFALNRTFSIEGDQFATMNGMAGIVFQVMERQNRAALQRMLEEIDSGDRPFDACDSEAELGVSLPGVGVGETVLGEDQGRVTLNCNGRQIASYEPGSHPAPPAAFWPTMFAYMTTHPALHRHIREEGSPPAVLETHFQFGGVDSGSATWRLVTVETVAIPYPLAIGMRNVTANTLDQIIGSGGAQLATDAVAGRAGAGAPTLENWGEHLASVRGSEGLSAAAMLILPTLNMFPTLDGLCDQGGDHAFCEILEDFRASEDIAPLALLEIGIAEQEGNSAAAIAAMQRAQATPLKEHPALGASFALALLSFDQEFLEQAAEAGLPTDVADLQRRALTELPYNPAYWTDVGDRYAAAYDYGTAYLLYDIAFALPMPDANANSSVLNAKVTFSERIRNDFPDTFLPR